MSRSKYIPSVYKDVNMGAGRANPPATKKIDDRHLFTAQRHSSVEDGVSGRWLCKKCGLFEPFRVKMCKGRKKK